ncbi:MAG: two-component regulator propeller domain-containing protein [Balneolaceae bacterium]
MPEHDQGAWNNAIEHGFTTEEGLPANGVNELIQDSRKYIWAATYNGLIRFDGKNIKVYNSAEIEDLGSNRFLTLLEDSNGCIWAGLEYSYILSICGDSTEVTNLDEHVGGFNNHVTHLREGPGRTFWIGTNNGLLLLKDGQFEVPDGSPSQNVQKIIFRDTYTYVLYQNHLLRFHPDETLDKEIARLSPEGVIITPQYQIQEFYDPDIIFTDFEIEGEDILLLTHAGLAQLRENDYKIVVQREQINQRLIAGMKKAGDILYLYGSDGVVAAQNINDQKNIRFEKYSSHFVNDVLIDHEGSIWQSTRSSGLQKLIFTPIVQSDLFSSLDNISVTASLFDRENSFWVGTNCDGLYRFSGGDITRYGAGAGIRNTCVWSLMEQRDGTIWAGTWGGGVYQKTEDSRVFQQFTPEGFEDVNEVLSVYEDRRGAIWFGSYYDGLFRYENGSIERVLDDEGKQVAAVRMFFEDSSGRFWMATDNGLKIFQDGRITEPENSGNIDRINFRTITEGPENKLWFGSYGRGLFLLTEEEDFKQINTEHGLYDETISQMEFDHQGNLWLGGNGGIFFIDSEQITLFLNQDINSFRVSRFGVNEGMTIRETTGGFMPASAMDEEGFLYIPTVQGMVLVETSKMKLNRSLPEVFIQNIQIDGETVENNYIENISYQNQRVVFQFAALSFINPAHIQIEYMLDGLDTEWNRAGDTREAVYTTLPPGDYELRVRASNNDGFWNEEGARLSFTILPPFWQQTWFLVLGILLFSGAVTGAFQYRMWRVSRREIHLQSVVQEQTSTIRKEKDQLQKAYKDLEKQKKVIEESNVLIEKQTKKLKRQDELKSRFFANVSHELRTPLTLIKGIAEQALKGRYGDYEEKLGRELRSMMTHTDRLETQLEYLLELSNIEIGKTTISKKIYDLNSQVALLCDYFKSWARQNEVNLSVEKIQNPLQVYADPGKMEKIFLSLFSNALAYTQKGNGIMIRTGIKKIKGKDWGQVVFLHNGKQLSEEEKKLIFDKFHQHTEVGGIQSNTGLALAREWIELHDGKIRVDFKPENNTCFEILLELIDLNTWTSMEAKTLPEEYPLINPLPAQNNPDDENVINKKPGKKKHKTVVIVEDDMVVSLYVQEILSDTYNIVTAEDGEDGMKKILETMPDLVISDVMMPVMNGYELCSKIRENPRTRSIPVVLLTAKAGDDSKLEGLQHGADAYLTKPFKESILKEVLQNLISSRDRLLQQFRNNQHLGHLLSGEESLLSKLNRLINENMENPDLTIGDLAARLHMSPRQLQRKIKQETGLTPKKYLRVRRLEAARHLLENNYGTITQVAYAAGFSTLSLFSSYFKKEFGKLPSEWGNKKK